MPRKKHNLDIRSGSPNDPSYWIPSRVYKHLCRCFRRQTGKLALTHTEFNAACNEYVSRAVSAWFRRRVPSNPDASEPKPKRIYEKRKRKSSFDSMDIRTILHYIHRVEFGWIILRREFRNLKKIHSNKSISLEWLKSHYSYLPQINDSTLLLDLEDTKTSSYKLALDEVAVELEIERESLERMLKPSYRRRAGMPSSLAHLYRDF